MSLSLGYRPGHLTVNLVRGTQFIDTIELTDPVTGLPTPWPVGTTAWLRLYKPGTAFDVTWPALVTGALMQWDVLPALVDDVPKGSTAQLWLDYPDPGLLPFVWVTGHVSFDGCGGSGFDTLLVIPPGFPGAGAIAVPVPGPQADLTPEERAELVEDIETEVLEELEPPINLVIRYNNIRSQG